MTAVARYRSAEGVQHVLVLERDARSARVVIVAVPVRVQRLPQPELRHLTPLDAYPPARAARQFLAAGRALGITPTARRALQQIRRAP